MTQIRHHNRYADDPDLFDMRHFSSDSLLRSDQIELLRLFRSMRELVIEVEATTKRIKKRLDYLEERGAHHG